MASNEGPLEDVRRIAETCEKLVEDVVYGRCSMENFGERLRNTGISSEAGSDYVQEVKQRLENQLSNTQSTEGGGPAGSATSVTGEQSDTVGGNAESETPTSGDVGEEVGWALLRSRLDQIRPNPSSGNQRMDKTITDLFKTLESSTSSDSTIPASVLTVAPHLSKLSKADSLDEHLRKTWELRQVYSTEKAMDPIIDLMQNQPLEDPIPRSVWRKILRDEFVDFERLYGSTDRNYSHKDDHEEFAGGFVLTRKEQVYSKKLVRTEADWTRIFSAWEAGVLLLYPHRVYELQKYRRTIIDLFRATPFKPTIAIYFDIEVRDRYARSPFRLDDRDQLQVPLLAQLFRGSASYNKRDLDSDPTSASQKRATVPCQNWNLGFCDDPCPNHRKHGFCCECGGQHRAKEFEECLAKLQEKRRGGRGGSGSKNSGNKN